MSDKIQDYNSFFRDLYQNFNDRKIDLVIASMADDVKWANGMDGGYVYGHDGVRKYWIKQFSIVSSNVTPMEIEAENGIVKVKVHQVVHDIEKKLLADEIVEHRFRVMDGKITEFHISST